MFAVIFICGSLEKSQKFEPAKILCQLYIYQVDIKTSR